jgi:hypothetical protein
VSGWDDDPSHCRTRRCVLEPGAVEQRPQRGVQHAGRPGGSAAPPADRTPVHLKAGRSGCTPGSTTTCSVPTGSSMIISISRARWRRRSGAQEPAAPRVGHRRPQTAGSRCWPGRGAGIASCTDSDHAGATEAATTASAVRPSAPRSHTPVGPRGSGLRGAPPRQGRGRHRATPAARRRSSRTDRVRGRTGR